MIRQWYKQLLEFHNVEAVVNKQKKKYTSFSAPSHPTFSLLSTVRVGRFWFYSWKNFFFKKNKQLDIMLCRKQS